jgi:hypothetical protein
VTDLSSIGTVVDVGGGQGRLLAGLLEATPGLSGVLVDRPEVVAGAEAVLRAAGVADRCAVVGGDFHTMANENFVVMDHFSTPASGPGVLKRRDA